MILRLPPLFSGVAAEGPPLTHAIRLAQSGCDGGTLVHGNCGASLEASMIFAPDTALVHAAQILPVTGIGLQNALGALAPPEVAVHLGWDGAIYVNGGHCGALTLIAPDPDPDNMPDWVIVALSLDLLPPDDDPGRTPDRTSLWAEGCGAIARTDLIEAWVRHSLVWINRWSDGELRALHREWIGLVHGLNKEVTQSGTTGTFHGVDETFAMLVKSGNTMRAIPLTRLAQLPDP